MKPRFDQAKWDNLIEYAYNRSKSDITCLVRFSTGELPAHSSPHGYLALTKNTTKEFRDLYDRADELVKIENGKIEVLHNSQCSIEQLTKKFFELTICDVPSTSFISTTGTIATKNRISKPIEVPPKDELWWQKEKRLAAERWDAVVALRKSVRSLLGM